MRNRFLILPLTSQSSSKIVVCYGEVRLDLNSYLVVRNRFAILSFPSQGIPKVVMCFGKVRLALIKESAKKK